MRSLDQSASAALADAAHRGSCPGRILLGVLETLYRAGIPYCVLHGYENYPQQVTSDVDCMISANVDPDQLAALFHENRGHIGADLVYWSGNYFVFAGKNADRSPCFLVLDLNVNYEISDLKFYSGAEVIESRYRHRQFWIPAAHLEFGGYLIRKINKAQLYEEQGRRLSALYAQDTAGCQQQIARFWCARSTALIASAASSGDWGLVRRFLPSLRAEMRMRARCRHPSYAIWSWVRRVGRRVRSACWPDGGLTVVFLGPDGAGKSSVIKAVPQALAGAFNRTTCYGFAPGILLRLRPPGGPNTQPHAAPPRSPIISVMRAVCYWLVYYLLCYRVTLRLHLAHSTLVLHDRHLVDALVDPKRYRYSGPMWLLRLIWWFVPRPDLIVLLDAPPEVLQARKQDVPFAESERQRKAYRTLVGSMANGHIVDAARPLERVVRDVHDIILNYLATRVAARVGRTRPTRASSALRSEKSVISTLGAPVRTNRTSDVMLRPIIRTLRRAYSRIIRDIKRSIFGIESYLNTEDRRVLEQVIFPYFLQRDDYKNVLFVGCHWYTKGYNTRFEGKKNYWTIEPSPSRQRYGAKQHIGDTLQNLRNHFRQGALDLILCNGVIGWGLDAKPDAEQAFRASYDCLREGGVLVVGWEDIDERRPFHPDECQSLHQLRPFLFPPLATAKYVTDTASRVTYNFYVKLSSAGAG